MARARARSGGRLRVSNAWFSMRAHASGCCARIKKRRRAPPVAATAARRRSAAFSSVLSRVQKNNNIIYNLPAFKTQSSSQAQG
jgi:hypothetical protein